MTNAIKAIEAKGYIVIASENKWLGELNEACPIVYEILNPDHSPVYGANGIAPEKLASWLDNLNNLNIAADTTATPAPTAYIPENVKKEKEYDSFYNEGGEGYNPYRA